MLKDRPDFLIQSIIAGAGVVAAFAAAAAAVFSGFLYSTTKDTAETQLRAYLVAQPPALPVVHSLENGHTVFAIGFALDNMGQTPAYEAQTRLAITTANNPLTQDIGLSDFASLVDRGVVGKKAEYGDIITRGFTPQEARQISDGANTRLYVRGHACYKSFHKPRHLSFCFAYLGDKFQAYTACGWPRDYEDADCPSELFSATKMPEFAITHVTSGSSITLPERPAR